MSGGQLSVDYHALADLASTLKSLSDEFDGLKDEIDGYRDAAGHDGVSDAMKKVSKNWSDERKKIVENMEEVSGYGEAAAEAYREVDEELAGEFSNAVS